MNGGLVYVINSTRIQHGGYVVVRMQRSFFQLNEPAANCYGWHCSYFSGIFAGVYRYDYPDLS